MFGTRFDSERYGRQLIQCVSGPMPIDQGNYAHTCWLLSELNDE